jgi:hypothetical protein
MEMADYPTGVYGNIGVCVCICGLSIHKMMQESIVFLIVGGSIFYLLRKTYLTFNTQNDTCEGCGLRETTTQQKKR